MNGCWHKKLPCGHVTNAQNRAMKTSSCAYSSPSTKRRVVPPFLRFKLAPLLLILSYSRAKRLIVTKSSGEILHMPMLKVNFKLLSKRIKEISSRYLLKLTVPSGA